MPHGGHEAEDRRRPARGDQGGPRHRHARPPRGWRATGGRDVGHRGRQARRCPEGRRRLISADEVERGARGERPGPPGASRPASVTRVTTAPTSPPPAPLRTADGPLDRAWTRAGLVALSVCRPTGTDDPVPGGFAAVVAAELGLDLPAVVAAEKVTGRAGDVTRLPVPPAQDRPGPPFPSRGGAR